LGGNGQHRGAARVRPRPAGPRGVVRLAASHTAGQPPARARGSRASWPSWDRWRSEIGDPQVGSPGLPVSPWFFHFLRISAIQALVQARFDPLGSGFHRFSPPPPQAHSPALYSAVGRSVWSQERGTPRRRGGAPHSQVSFPYK
jgi:hypothetical protein